MSSAIAFRRRLLNEAVTGLRAGFDWWIGELSALLPGRLAGRAPDSLIVAVAPDGVTLACRSRSGMPVMTPARASGGSVRAAPVPAILHLPRDLVLARTVTLAAAAEENLSEVVGFQLDRFTPFELDEVYLGCRIIGRDPDAEAITVALAVAPRHEVDRLVAAALLQGLACNAVLVTADAFEWGMTDDLALESALVPAAAAGSGRITRALWALALLLLAASIAIPLIRGRATLLELQREVATLRREAQAVADLRSEIEDRSEQAAIPIRRWQRTQLSTLLAELTRLVPDSGWVTQLEIDAGSVQLTGYASAANALIPALESSPILTNAAFRSPVTQDAVRGVEQFHLSADLRKRNE